MISDSDLSPVELTMKELWHCGLVCVPWRDGPTPYAFQAPLLRLGQAGEMQVRHLLERHGSLRLGKHILRVHNPLLLAGLGPCAGI